MNYYQLSTDEALKSLDTSVKGLSSASAKSRQNTYGTNSIVLKGTPLWRKLVEPFIDVFMAVLAIAVIISIWHKDYIDAVIIGVIILVSAIIYYVQRFSTERVLKSLRATTSENVQVLRDGAMALIPKEQLVPGDIILVSEGDKIPADARVLSTDSFRVDESQLTGESLPISKQTKKLSSGKQVYEMTNMIFQGSFVISGTAHALVVATGNTTEFGKLAELSARPNTTSPVQEKIGALVTKIIFIIIAVSLISFVLTLRQGMDIIESIRFVIALAVSAVPEGLPIAISVILVLGMRRMAAQKALIRSMRAIETLGTVTTIATDKTGTLTENKLTVKQLWSPTKTTTTLEQTIAHSLNYGDKLIHDPLDVSLHDYVSKKRLSVKAAPLHNFPFEHTVAMSGALFHYGAKYRLYVKGAPEKIIERATMTEAEREQAYRALHNLTQKGYRVIALAFNESTRELKKLSDLTKKTKLTFHGFVAVADTLRKEAKSAIAVAAHAGITVRMITGDHFETAYQIGKELGMVKTRDQVFDSRTMHSLSDDELEAVVKKTRVFARVVPEDKHRLLSVLKRGDITAMTGDGVNDVPALTNANVGIAMGSGASIAKDAGHMILVDDNFKSIVDAIKEGRIIFSNIKKMLTYLLATNTGEVLLNLAALFVGAPIPLVPVQILWVNLVTDTCLVIPIGLEPGDKDIMKQKPFAPKAPLLSRVLIMRIIISAIVVATITLTTYLIFLSLHDVNYARTMAFGAIVAIQWGNALAMRSQTESVWELIRKPSRAFWIGLGGAVGLQLIAILTPLSAFLHLVPVNAWQLAFVMTASFILPIIVIEAHKRWCKNHKQTVL